MLLTDAQPKTTLQKMQDEARRNYLLHYMKKISDFIVQHKDSGFEKFQKSKYGHLAKMSSHQTILIIEDYLDTVVDPFFKVTKPSQEQLALQNELKVARLKNIGDDAAGIRTNLAKHFQQLKLQERGPCVNLTKTGLGFNWDTEHAQQEFFTLLKNCGIDVQLETSTPTLDGYSNATHSVVVSHRHLEKLLQLSQYHPYNLQAAANDLYEAKDINLNRAECLIHSAKTDIYNTLKNVVVNETGIISLNQDYDLVAVSLDVLPPQQDKKHQPHHVVILLDDSKSMNHNNRMRAANQALKQFIAQLPEDTLISLQPFCTATALVKQSVKDIKAMPEKERDKLFTIPAEGSSTPLVEMLACSALFLRKSGGENFLLTEADLNNATVVMLTDGDVADTAADATQTMQTSTKMATASNIKIEGISQEEKRVSYGVDGFACRQLPVVFSIAIGKDSSQKFIEDLAQHLHCPHAFIDDTSTDMQQQINDAFNLFLSIKGRIPGVFVGLTYGHPTTGQKEVVALETQNLFFGRTRNVEFRVPKGAKNIHVCIMENDSQAFFNIDTQNTLGKDLIKTYIEEQFLQIRTSYSAKFKQLKDVLKGNNTTQTFGGGGRRAVFIPNVSDEISKEVAHWKLYCTDDINHIQLNQVKDNTIFLVLNTKAKSRYQSEYKYTAYFVRNGQLVTLNNTVITMDIASEQKFALGELVIHEVSNPIVTTAVKFLLDAPKKESAEKELEKLKQDTIQEITSLLQFCSDSEQRGVMTLFLDAIKNLKPKDDRDYTQSNVHNSRQAVAKFTQTRWLGTAVPKTRLQPVEKTIFTDIDQMGDGHEAVLEQIRQKPELLTQKQQVSTFQATPLMYALVKLINATKGSSQKKALGKLIKAILKEFNLSMLDQDVRGQTLLHRAVWGGEVKIAKAIIEKAKKDGVLNKLKLLRNQVSVGATQGETFVENIRSTDHLSTVHKKELLAMIAEPVKSETLFTAITDLNTKLIKTEIAKDPDDLNRHGEESIGSPTPLFAMLYKFLVKTDVPEDLKPSLRQCVLELLEQYKDTIDFCESNADGNTVLHYALFHGELDIAEKIITVAAEKGQLLNLLKARNVLSNADGKGETPVLNLLNQYSALRQQFEKVCATTFKCGGLIIDFSQLPKELQEAFYQIRNSYFQCKTICELIFPHLTGLQLTEINHLKTVHDKRHEGLSSYYWLKAAPVPELKSLITDCGNVQSNKVPADELEKLNQLSKNIAKLLSNETPYTTVADFISAALYKSEPKLTDTTIRAIFKRAEIILSQYAMFTDIKEPFELTLFTTMEAQFKQLPEDHSIRTTDMQYKNVLHQKLEQLLKQEIKPQEVASFVAEALTNNFIKDPQIKTFFEKANQMFTESGFCTEIKLQSLSKAINRHGYLAKATQLTCFQKLANVVVSLCNLAAIPTIEFNVDGLHIKFAEHDDNKVAQKFSSLFQDYNPVCLGKTVKFANSGDILNLIVALKSSPVDFCVEAIKPRYLNYDSDIGITAVFRSPLEAALVFQTMPKDCKDMIKFDGSNEMIIKYGVAPANEGYIGIKFTTQANRDICCKLLSLTADSNHVLFGQNRHRDLTTDVFIASTYFNKTKENCCVM